jgi:membrane protein implicated in regulation of membrane protease activity
MKRNVGGIDMAMRLIVGAVLVAFGLVVQMSTVWQVIVFVVAAIAIVTAIARYCPANALLGINTSAKKSQAQSEQPGGQAK